MTDIEVLNQFTIPDDTAPNARELELFRCIFGNDTPESLGLSVLTVWIHKATGKRVLLVDTPDRESGIEQLRARLRQIAEGVETHGSA